MPKNTLSTAFGAATFAVALPRSCNSTNTWGVTCFKNTAFQGGLGITLSIMEPVPSDSCLAKILVE